MGFWAWLTGRGPLVPETAAVRVWEPDDKLDQSSNAMTGAISEAWQVWRQVGEIHYVTTQQARLASRLDWQIKVGGEEIDFDQAEQVLAEAFGPDLRDHVRTMMLHIQVAGAFFFIRDQATQQWDVVTWPAGYKVRQQLDRADIVVEITQEDPADPKLTDSPVLAARQVARELMLTRQQARVAARNRTAQLNTVLYPREGAGPDAESFERKFTRVMTEPLLDEMSASSVVPNLIGFQGEKIKDWRTIDLTGPIDERLHERVEHLIRQLSVILDIPPEIMTGLGDTSHWNAWEISEDNWLGHVEPMAKLVGQALSEGVARAAEFEDPNIIEIEPDPAPLLKRRPSLPDVMGAFDRGLVSSEWTRRQLGAGEEDAPAPGELRLVGNPQVGLPTVVQVPIGTVEERQTGEGDTPSTGPRAVTTSQPAVAEPTQPQAASPTRRRTRRILQIVKARGADLPPEVSAGIPFSTDRLAAIDLQAFDSTADLIDAVVVRVLERLGSQLRSSISHDKDLRTEVADIPNVDLPSLLDQSRLQNVDQTVSDTSTQPLTGGLERIVRRAYGYTRSAGIDIQPDPDLTAQAVELLLQGVAQIVADRMDGQPGVAAGWRLARRVVAIAGGNPDPAPQQVAAPGVPEDEETPLAGIALGLAALAFILDVFRLQPGGYRWQHNSIGDPHPVHDELDGAEFSGGTIPTATYTAYIGDHAGCQCAAIPLWRGASTIDIIGEPPEGVTIQ